MVLLEIRRILEKRRCNLINVLENGRDEMELSKQHQLFGAIKELENVLKTLDYHRHMDINSTPIELRSDKETPIFQKFSFKIKKMNKQ
ncbi:MAG: hypothetical protein ABIE94_04255 [archaeon]